MILVRLNIVQNVPTSTLSTMELGGDTITKRLLFTILLVTILSLTSIAGISASDVNIQNSTVNNSTLQEKYNNTSIGNKSITTQSINIVTNATKTASSNQTVNSTNFTVAQIKSAASKVRSYIEINHQLPSYVQISTIKV